MELKIELTDSLHHLNHKRISNLCRGIGLIFFQKDFVSLIDD